MRRSTLALLLAFLLIAFQQQVVMHALEHVGAGQQAGVASPANAPEHCAECDLLAAGADSIDSGSRISQASAVPLDAAPAAFTSRAVGAPAVYSSRGPPALL
jgi:hypothetical protein